MKYRLYISYCGRGSFDVKHVNFDNITLAEIAKKISEYNTAFIIVGVQFFENTLQELRHKFSTTKN